MFLKILLSDINSFAAFFNVIYSTSQEFNATDFRSLNDQNIDVFSSKKIYSVVDFLVK